MMEVEAGFEEETVEHLEDAEPDRNHNEQVCGGGSVGPADQGGNQSRVVGCRKDPQVMEQVAETLVSIATLLELKGENPFKARAYLNAAEIRVGL